MQSTRIKKLFYNILKRLIDSANTKGHITNFCFSTLVNGVSKFFLKNIYNFKYQLILIYAKPEKMNTVGYYNRYTALTIVEPWVSYRMEHNVAPIMSRGLTHNAGNRSNL